MTEQTEFRPGQSFGHFNENSRRKKLKLKSKKLKTQEQINQKLKDFHKTLKILENLSISCTNFQSKGTFQDKVFPNSQYFLKNCPKTKEFHKTHEKMVKNPSKFRQIHYP